jgi:hypothetical protein
LTWADQIEERPEVGKQVTTAQGVGTIIEDNGSGLPFLVKLMDGTLKWFSEKELRSQVGRQERSVVFEERSPDRIQKSFLTSSLPTTPRSFISDSVVSGHSSMLSSGHRGRLVSVTESSWLPHTAPIADVTTAANSETGSLPACSRQHSEAEQSGASRAAEALLAETSSEIVTPQVSIQAPSIDNEALCDNSFSIATDLLAKWAIRLSGVLFLGLAVLCLFSALSQFQSSGSKFVALGMCIVAVLLVIIGLVLIIRRGAPSSIMICRANGDWAISIHRHGASPKVRSMTDLEAYLETFGYCDSVVLQKIGTCRFIRRRFGYTTARKGTLHLFFSESVNGPACVMTVSLEEPFVFFCKLRDVMEAIDHALAAITVDYVADWERDNQSTLAGTSTRGEVEQDQISPRSDVSPTS